MPRQIPNRFALAHSYKKDQALALLSELTLEQLSSIVNFNNKDVLLNVINNAMTKSELHELLFRSSISDENLHEFITQKNKKSMFVPTSTEKKTVLVYNEKTNE
jgi:hypothetical protein